MLTVDLVHEAEKRIRPYVLETPLVFSPALSVATKKNIFLKLETQQYTSSFKPRPAFNNILGRLAEARERGVIASSSGNFAQAVAYAAQKLGVSAKIVMTRSASAYKKARTRGYGAEVVECGNSFEERQSMLHSLIEKEGRILLHQYDTYETMAGDATVATEFLRQISGDISVIVPTSGGGLTAATSFTVKTMRPKSQVFGVLPHTHSWPVEKSSDQGTPTIAEALVPAKPGEKTHPIVTQHLDGLAYVANDEIEAAMRMLAAEQRLIVEPGGAAPIAALLAGKLPAIKHENVVCVLTGGNIDIDNFTKMVALAEHK